MSRCEFALFEDCPHCTGHSVTWDHIDPGGPIREFRKVVSENTYPALPADAAVVVEIRGTDG